MVYTVEANPRNYGFSEARFALYRKVCVNLGDSRGFLRPYLLKDQSILPRFAYLDAHWEKDLPLLEECELLLNDKHDWVIMIDDFEVPDYFEYKFDNYGPEKV